MGQTQQSIPRPSGGSSGELILASIANFGFSGVTQVGSAGEALGFGNICYYDTAGKWSLAVNIADSKSALVKLGICILPAAADNDPTKMLIFGKVRTSVAYSFTTGGAVFISENFGELTETLPSASGAVVRVCGFMESANTLFFNPSPDSIKLA